jgi:hypothetical protein
MVRVALAAVLCGFFAISACSGKMVDDGAGDDDGTPAPQKCEAYASTWCNKVFGCYVKVGRIKEAAKKTNVDQCYNIIVDKLPCSEVASVSDDYDTCLSQINGMACSRWDVPATQVGTVVPPSSCEGALSFDSD